jgi:anti-sigma B factor antagonist
MDLHRDPIARESVIRAYLGRSLDQDQTEQFEAHYMACDECFEELRGTELLIRGLAQPVIARRVVNGVSVLQFTENTHLLGGSLPLQVLAETVRAQQETRVLIDLSQVSRIDSTGLGVLINCYVHALGNAGALKLLNPGRAVKNVLSVTHMDSVLSSFEDEDSAIRSFEQ